MSAKNFFNNHQYLVMFSDLCKFFFGIINIEPYMLICAKIFLKNH